MMRVWWRPQIPCEAFLVPVADVEQAKLILRTLSAYDAFQFHHRIKPDYCNAGGLEVWDEQDGEWVEWETEEGDSIGDVMRGAE